MLEIAGTLTTIRKFSVLMVGVSFATLSVGGCDLTRNHLKMDRSGHMEMQDYRDALAPRIAEEEAAKGKAPAGQIPELQPYVATPSASALKAMPLVSISVNQTVPLRDALFELASQAGFDIQLDPRIRGSVIFTARERPFDEVIGKLCDISGLRYKFEDHDSVRVELDTPFHKTYKIDYLSFVRTNTSTVNNDVSVVSGDGANTGSSFSASSTNEANFWGELQTNLTQILGVPQARSALTTSRDPAITAAPTNPAPVAPVVTPNPDGTQNVEVAPPQATLQVTSLPTDTQDDSAQRGDASTQTGQSPDGSSFAINRQAGMISVNATERQHKRIEQYLADLRRSVTSQVLIEAKILEVTLNDEYAVGINWAVLENLIGEFNIGITGGASGLARPALPDAVASDANFSIGYTGNDISAVIDAISRFGTVKALASPRLTVLNNQSAVLNVANNRVYFEIDVDVTEATVNTPRTVDIQSQIRNVPEGVLINVQPSIDLDDGTISMAVRPTVTRIVDNVLDPGVAFVSQGLTTPIESRIPVVNIQEMDSVVRVRSGEALVMGGLMQDRTDSSQQGVPVLGEIPLLGSAFRKQVDKVQKTELVVFLKATIIEGGNIHRTDRDLYRRFSGDRRPL